MKTVDITFDSAVKLFCTLIKVYGFSIRLL